MAQAYLYSGVTIQCYSDVTSCCKRISTPAAKTAESVLPKSRVPTYKDTVPSIWERQLICNVPYFQWFYNSWPCAFPVYSKQKTRNCL